MTAYIFTISFLDENSNLHYSTVKGVYNNKKDAKEAAVNSIKRQKSMWENSYFKQKKNKDSVKVFLYNADGFCKIYCLRKMEMNTTV